MGARLNYCLLKLTSAANAEALTEFESEEIRLARLDAYTWEDLRRSPSELAHQSLESFVAPIVGALLSAAFCLFVCADRCYGWSNVI